MPRYDFKCQICGITFESITPTDVLCVPCPDCQKMMNKHAQAHRQLSAPSQIHIH